MKRLLGLTACMLPLLSVAEFVVPVGSVEEYVNVRMDPDDKSEVVGRLYQGDSASIVNSLAGWHEIVIAGGATGFISAEWTIVLEELPDTRVAESKTQTVVENKKENVVELTPQEALDALANIEPVTFSYTREDQQRHVGFNAGNVPDLIASSESEGLKPLEIVAVLTRVVKLQQDRIAELESRLDERDLH